MAALDPAEPILLAVLAASLALLLLGARRRILLRLGLRNIARKRGQVAIAIAGLLVSTSIISGSFVFSDSWRATLENIVIRSLDLTDEVITRPGPSGLPDFFPYATYGNLTGALAGGALPHVAAVAPRIIVPAAVEDTASRLFRAQVNLVGYDGGADLGQFLPAAGALPPGPLGPDQAIVNQRLASRMDARVGDRLEVFLGAPRAFTIAAIVEDRGRGGWQHGEDLFVDLAVAQGLTGRPGQINHLLVANVGGATQGYRVSDQATRELRGVVGPGYSVEPVKRDGIDEAKAEADSFTRLFLVLSSFSIISGLLLIVSIFVMLAEERKAEMGIARALGMRRAHLVQAFLLEGFVYALASAALGAVVGVAVGATIIWTTGQIFRGQLDTIVIAVEPPSLALAFGIGALLTLGTIAATSWYVSRLNIVRAIRGLPEPIPRRSTRRQLLLGSLALASGALLAAEAFRERSNLALTAGVPLAALGIAALLLRAVAQRALLTATGLFIVGWLLKPYTFFPGGIQIEGFIVVGVLLVLAGVLVVMGNAEALMAATTALVRRRRRLLPVVRTAIAYPMNKRFRTGMSLAMFALIIFTITTLAMFQALFGTSVAAFTQQVSGGYEIVGQSNPLIPAGNFSGQLASNATVAAEVGYHEELVQGIALAASDRMNTSVPYRIVGITPAFAERNNFTLQAMAPGYASAREVWRAVLANASLAVVDGGTQPSQFGPPPELPVGLGGTIDILAPDGTNRRVKVIGIEDQPFTQALFVAPGLPRELLGLSNPSLFYFKVAPGHNPAVVAKDLERLFLNLNLQTVVFEEAVRDSIQSTLSFFQLLQGFLALGLVVGIAGLGVVTLRNVAERRNVMGALRALGFRRTMVLGAFLLENSFITLLGAAIGVALGIGLAFRLRGEIEFLSHGSFLIPWDNLLLVVAIAYGASLLATSSPARRAARMPPAEALRIAE